MVPADTFPEMRPSNVIERDLFVILLVLTIILIISSFVVDAASLLHEP